MFWWMNFETQAETDSPSRRAACSARNAAVDSSVNDIFVVAILRAYLLIASIGSPREGGQVGGCAGTDALAESKQVGHCGARTRWRRRVWDIPCVPPPRRLSQSPAWPAAHPSQGSPDPPAPPPEPRAIRACLTPDVAAEFDREWEIVLDQAKRDQDLEPVHDLLAKWRHFAYAELKAPGTYFRVLATAAQTLVTGQRAERVRSCWRVRLGAAGLVAGRPPICIVCGRTPGPRQSSVSAGRRQFKRVLTQVARDSAGSLKPRQQGASLRQTRTGVTGSPRSSVPLPGVAADHGGPHDFAGTLGRTLSMATSG